MEALMYVVFGVFLLLFYSIGFSTGQRVIKKEESVTPITKKIVNAITNKNEETSESYAEDEDNDEISKVLHNIEVYDGTGKGQIDV